MSPQSLTGVQALGPPSFIGVSLVFFTNVHSDLTEYCLQKNCEAMGSNAMTH